MRHFPAQPRGQGGRAVQHQFGPRRRDAPAQIAVRPAQGSEFARHPLHAFGRHRTGGEQPVPERGLEARHLFGDRGHIGQQRQPRGGGDREAARGAGAQMFQRDRDIAAEAVDIPCQQRVHNQLRAAIGHMRQLDAGLLLQHGHGQVGGGADAGAAEGQPIRVRLGLRQEAGEVARAIRPHHQGEGRLHHQGHRLEVGDGIKAKVAAQARQRGDGG